MEANQKAQCTRAECRAVADTVVCGEPGNPTTIAVTDWDGKSADGASAMMANAAFIAEAFTVLHETGLSPRELAEQRAELLAACEKLLTRVWNSQPTDDTERGFRTHAIDTARAAIFAATGADKFAGYDKGPLLRAAIARATA